MPWPRVTITGDHYGRPLRATVNYLAGDLSCSLPQAYAISISDKRLLVGVLGG